MGRRSCFADGMLNCGFRLPALPRILARRIVPVVSALFANSLWHCFVSFYPVC